VNWIADHHARSNSTHVMGEAWVRETYADGEVDSAVSQPHVWEQLLFYLTSLIAYDDSSGTAYDKIGNDVYRTWRRHDATITGLKILGNGGPYAPGDTVEGAATVANEVPVAQRYHLKVQIDDRTAATKNVGPLPPGETTRVSLSWTVGDEEEAPGSRDVRISVGRSVATGNDDRVDPADIAARPTTLTAD